MGWESNSKCLAESVKFFWGGGGEHELLGGKSYGFPTLGLCMKHWHVATLVNLENFVRSLSLAIWWALFTTAIQKSAKVPSLHVYM